ncbi:hypothetical protein Tco_0671122 [Tanacetum coccineum]
MGVWIDSFGSSYGNVAKWDVSLSNSYPRVIPSNGIIALGDGSQGECNKEMRFLHGCLVRSHSHNDYWLCLDEGHDSCFYGSVLSCQRCISLDFLY